MGEGEWVYPAHEDLLHQCGLFNIETYVERRRGTLRAYLDGNRMKLMEEAKMTNNHSRDAHKVLWWNQKYISKTEMEGIKNSWFKN